MIEAERRCCHYGFGLLILIFTISQIFVTELQAQARIVITPENTHQFFYTGEVIGKRPVYCHVGPKRTRPGLLDAKTQTVWQALARIRRNRLTRMRNRGLPQRRINRVAKRLRARPRRILCENLLNEAPVVQDQQITVKELKSTSFALVAQHSMGAGVLSYQIVSKPKKGALSGKLPTLTFTAGHSLGNDKLTYRVTNTQTGQVSELATVNIKIEASGSQFTGNPNSLKPYRANLTEAEARHIVRKVAYSDPTLVQIGMTQGLSALVDAMLNSPEVPGVEAEAYTVAQPLFSGGGTRWNSSGAARYWDYIARNGNPFRARMALFWHEHFPTHIGDLNFTSVALHQGIPGYMDTLIRENVLGNFVEDLLKGYLWTLAGAPYYLDNRFNHGGSEGSGENQNFAREYLELFALGTHGTGDRKHTPIFNENDVEAATAFLGGFVTSTVANQTYLGFSFELHDSTPQTIFAGQPHEAKNVVFLPEEFIDFTAHNVDDMPRYIGEKLYAQFISPDTSEEIVQAMADLLIKHSYEIKPVMKALLSSSAMFAQSSRNVCIESAYEAFTGLMRKLNFPMTNQINILSNFDNAVSAAGQRPLAPDTVFAWERNCGVNRAGETAYGEEYISPQYIVGKQRNLTDILRRVNSDGNFNWTGLLPSLSATPKETVDHFSKIFDMPISNNERSLLVQYLTHITNSSHVPVEIEWDTGNQSLMKSKLSGLVELFFIHPRSRFK